MAHPLPIRPCKVQFGPFVADLRTGELRKHDLRIKLPDRSFSVLAMLLENPGEVVTREEIRARLWPDGTFVDFDNNINSAIGKLRAALGDNAAAPRYIETAQRGYRFTAPVEVLSGIAPSTEELPPVQLSPPVGTLPRVEPKRRDWWWASIGIAGVVICAVALYIARHSHPTPAPEQGRIMLAVLPFENLTGDASQDYFSDGLTEEMITHLGEVDPKHLGVIARTSVMQFKNRNAPIDDIARQLGVGYVMEGSVRRDADHVRVTAQLVEAKQQTQVWARQYDRDLTGLLALQAEIAHEIADEIQLTLSDAKPAPHAPVTAEEYGAYDLYLQGQYFFNQRSESGLQQAIGYFQKAIASNPRDARSYAAMADCYALMPGYSGKAPADYIPQARAAALQALNLDASLPEAHTALALVVQNYDWDWTTAEKEFRRAIELNPNYATAHHWYAEHLMWRGRFDEALQQSELARQLDPLSLIIAADNAVILYNARQYDRSIERFRSVLAVNPNFLRAQVIALAYLEKGMYDEAFSVLRKGRGKSNSSYWYAIAYAYGRSGQPEQAHRALQKLLALNDANPVDPRMIAVAYIGVGDRPKALAWLQKACDVHSNEMTSLKVSPQFDSLRDDPKFHELTRRVGLE